MVRHKIHHVNNGEIIKLHKRKTGEAVFIDVCCDCGLAHLKTLKDKGGYFRIQAWRDETATRFVRNLQVKPRSSK